MSDDPVWAGEATTEGECDECGETIEVGILIVRMADDRYLHLRCWKESLWEPDGDTEQI